MKKVINTIVLLMVFALLVQAQPKLANYKEVEKTFIKGLKSDIPGIRLASIVHLGELKSEKAVGYFEDMLEDSESLDEKLAVVESLLIIGSEDSREVIADFMKDCNNESLKEKCKGLLSKYPENVVSQNSTSL